VFCAALLALGLFTRLSAVPLVATMRTAAFITHGADPFAEKELALVSLTGFTAVLLMAPGSFALQTYVRDRLRGRGSVNRFWLG